MSDCLSCGGTAVTSDDQFGRPCPDCKGTGTDQSSPLKPITDENCTYCNRKSWKSPCGNIIKSGFLLDYTCTREKGHIGRCVACGGYEQHDITGVKL